MNEIETQPADVYGNPPWPPSDAKPGDVWGPYRLDSDGWWRLAPPAPDTVQSLIQKARELDQRWAREEDGMERLGYPEAVSAADQISDCRRQLREAFGIGDAK